MRNISYNEAFEEFTINNDPTRIIRFNPGDPDLIQRLRSALKRINLRLSDVKNIPLQADGSPMVPEESLDVAAEALGQFNIIVKEAINGIFMDDSVYDTAFAGQSPLCIVQGKKEPEYLVEAFLGAVGEVIEEAVKDYGKKSEARMRKYTAGYKK